MDLLLTILLLVIIASSIMVGFTGGRLFELRHAERILREIADEAVREQEGEANDAEG